MDNGWLKVALPFAVVLAFPALSRAQPTETASRSPIDAAATRSGGAPGQAAAVGSNADRRAFGRAFGGFFSFGGSTGPEVGGGLAGRPFSNRSLEILGDGSYARLGEADSGIEITATVWQISGNLVYNFFIPDQKVVPFAGGGLLFGHASAEATIDIPFFGGISGHASESDTTLQILGGLEFPLGAGRGVRAETASQVLFGRHGGLGAGRVLLLMSERGPLTALPSFESE